jgi:hypothetical protein
MAAYAVDLTPAALKNLYCWFVLAIPLNSPPPFLQCTPHWHCIFGNVSSLTILAKIALFNKDPSSGYLPSIIVMVILSITLLLVIVVILLLHC